MDLTERKALIDKAQEGDRIAFESLVDPLRGRLRALIQSRLGAYLRRRVDVEDVLQETLLRAYRSVGRFRRQDEDSFFRWLGGIANHVICEVARREKREMIRPLDDEDSPSDEVSRSKAGERDERFDRLQDSLNSLDADYRRVILLARIERLPIKEVARRMDRSPEAVTQLLRRALLKLKKSFGSTDSFHLPPRRLEDRTSDQGGADGGT